VPQSILIFCGLTTIIPHNDINAMQHASAVCPDKIGPVIVADLP